MRSFVTTHVLDVARGLPAAGIPVTLAARGEGGRWTEVATAVTDDDGRVAALGPEALPSGTYRLTFAVEEHLAAHGADAFYPEVTITVRLDGEQEHYHLPILLSPFAVSTYRGS